MPGTRVGEHLDDPPAHDVEVLGAVEAVGSWQISGSHDASLTVRTPAECTSFIVCGEVVTSPNVNTG